VLLKTTFSKVIGAVILIVMVWGGYFLYLKNSQIKAQISDQTLVLNSQTESKKLNLEMVEIADTGEERARGLMYRLEMCQKCGLLFIFQYSERLSFWMRNTYIPLDIIFLDENGKIIKIHPDTQIKNDKILYESGSPAMYALEVNAGYSKSNNLQEGDTINLTELLRNTKEYQFA